MSRRNLSDVPGLSLNSTSTTYPPICLPFYFPVGLCDLLHMAAHDILSAVRIVRGDGIEHRAMRFIGDLILAGPLQRHMALLGQPRGDGLVDRRVDRIAGNQCENIVERYVGALERSNIVDRRFVSLQRGAKFIQFRSAGVLSGMARQSHFEESARFLEMP